MADKISVDELKSKLDEFTVIDVREPDELATGKIDNSTHMPLGLVIRKAKKNELDDDLKKKKICTYCGTGYRGNIAADELNKAGFGAVTLDGGYGAWKQAG